VVVIVTVTFCGPVPVGANGFGETLQVVNAGFPEQLNVTFCVKPVPGVTANVYVAVWPAGTVAVCDETGVSAKSGPLPFSETMWGLPVALSATESVALRDPPAVGVNVTLI
jgi:hypothetical protein